MATQFSMVQIINAALLAQGQERLTSENDGSIEWQICANNWPLIVEAELETSKLFFTHREVELQTRTTGRFGFEDGYMVPAEALHVRECFKLHTDGTRTGLDWVQDDTFVYVNKSDGVWVEYTYAPAASKWLASFARGIQLKIEAVILRAVKEEFAEALETDDRAEIQLSRARTSSSKSKSEEPLFLRGGRFVNARMRRG